MNRQIVIHPDYSGLRDFITRLPDIFLHEGEYLHDGRNKIKIFDVCGLKVNVKRYRIPIFFNRFIYLYLRKTKAERAYEYALRLQKMGIHTPVPIAYIIEKKGMLLGYSYFISIQEDYSRRFYEFGNAELTEEHAMIWKEFGRYTARLHQQNVCHQDYSPGNILFDLKNGKPEFVSWISTECILAQSPLKKAALILPVCGESRKCSVSLQRLMPESADGMWIKHVGKFCKPGKNIGRKWRVNGRLNFLWSFNALSYL